MTGNLYKELQYAARSLRKKPAFALVTIITLALGIGATTAVFSVVNSVLLRPLPFRDPDQLVWVWSRRPDNNRAPFSLPDFLDHRDQNQTLLEIAAFSNIGLSLSGLEKTERLQGLRVSANLFQLLGVNASYGRLMVPQDDEPGQRHVVVLTYECWLRRFAGDSQLVGKTLSLNGESYSVIGILPRGFPLPLRGAELAIPLSPDSDPLRNVRNSVNFLRLIARLKPDVTRHQAGSDLNAIVRHQRQQFGEAYSKKTGINVVPLYEELVGDVRTGLLILLGAVVSVLLIGCSNLAALALTRTASRYQEIAIRKALGATSARLVTQLLSESLLLALLGGVAGLLLATFGVRALLSLTPAQLPRSQEIGVDARVLAFAVAASVLSALIFGILPAWQAARAEMNRALKLNSRGAGEGARLNRWRSILVIAEVGVSFVLLIGAGLLIQSFQRVQAIQPGFDPSHTVAARFSLPKSNYQNRAAVALFCEKLIPGVQTLPGVEAVGAVSILPMSGSANIIEFSVVGRATAQTDTYAAQFRAATPGYFMAMRIPLLQGRGFSEHDRADSVAVALVNEAMAHRLWPDGNAVGAYINIDDNNTGPRPVEITGVVGNVRHQNLETPETLDIYIPLAQIHEDNIGMITNSQYWVIRSKGEGQSVESNLLKELQKIDREVATSNIRPMEDYLSESVAPRRFSLRILTIFAIAALLLAVTGIYGVVSYNVSQRTSEIGIRLALGAGRARIFRLILGQGVGVVFLGLALGLGGAFALTRLIRTLLFGVAPTDPPTFVFVSLILLVVALIACSLPARRATKVDPLVALRNE